MPGLQGRAQPPALLAGTAGVVLAAFATFALARGQLIDALISMGLLGLGVGGFSATMPAVILAVTPAGETSSAMGFNQVVRSVGFSVGSAIGGLTLAASTSPGHVFPADSGYTRAAWIGAALMAATAAIGLALRAAQRHLRAA